jgi:type VI secretion system secreted protein Hcp
MADPGDNNAGRQDAFLKVDGIPGESKDSVHKNEIELITFYASSSQAGTMATGGGGGGGKMAAQDKHVVMYVNKACPQLMLACATGKHIKEAVISVRKAGTGPKPGTPQQDYMTITLSNVLISRFEADGHPEKYGLPFCDISLNYSKIEYKYREQNNDGSLQPGVITMWDLAQGSGA